jgi:hypothetical protein
MSVLLAVAGAHLSGQPLNDELTSRGAELVATVSTAPLYRLYALATAPPKPGLVRVTRDGRAIEVEVWRLDHAAFGSFVADLAQPMTIAQLTLADGSTVCGFSCEPLALDGAADITAYGGWRAYRAAPDSAGLDSGGLD